MDYVKKALNNDTSNSKIVKLPFYVYSILYVYVEILHQTSFLILTKHNHRIIQNNKYHFYLFLIILFFVLI